MENTKMLTPRKGLNLAAALVAVLTIALVTGVSLSWQQTALGKGNDEAAVREALLKSASSFAQNDMTRAAQVWVNDESLTVFESGHANYGWADYRDNHLG